MYSQEGTYNVAKFEQNLSKALGVLLEMANYTKKIGNSSYNFHNKKARWMRIIIANETNIGIGKKYRDNSSTRRIQHLGQRSPNSLQVYDKVIETELKCIRRNLILSFSREESNPLFATQPYDPHENIVDTG